MNRRKLLMLTLLLITALAPARVYAAAELDLRVEFASPIMEEEGEQAYEWTLKNDSPNDVQDVYLRADDIILQEIGKLGSGETVSGRGILDIKAEDLGRYICFATSGYAEIPNENADIEQKKVTLYVESTCNAIACKTGAPAQAAAPQPPQLRLGEEAAEESFEIEACAYAQKSTTPSDMQNELVVFVKNNGSTEAKTLEVLVNKEVKAQSETLSAGKSLVLRCPITVENGKAIQPTLRYVNNKGKTISKALDKIEFYQEDALLSLKLRADNERPTPRTAAGLYIDISNTGEKTVSGIKLFDYQGNPVQTPKSTLKAGETMSVYSQCRLQRAAQLAYYARYKNKSTVVSASPSIAITPEIPEGTAQMQLRITADKSELRGVGRDRVVFTCTLSNNGSYTLSGVLLKYGEQVIGSCAVLPAGEKRVYKSAYLLDGAGELLFVATAADETGVMRECSAVASMRVGEDFEVRDKY